MHVSALKQSFLNPKKLLGVIMLDVLFLVLSILIITLFFRYMQQVSIDVQVYKPFADQLETYMNSATGAVPSDIYERNLGFLQRGLIFYYSRYLFSFGIAVLLLFLIFSLIKGWVWAGIHDESYTRRYFMKFNLLSFLLGLWWVSLFIFSYRFFQKEFALKLLAVLFLLSIHFSMVVFALFRKKSKIFAAVKQGFMIGTKKIFHLLVPYVLIVLLFSLFTFLLGLLYVNLQSRALLAVLLLFYVALFAWLKIYVHEVLAHIALSKVNS